ncbi:MAG: ATP synthase F1 subunit delta [Bacteroidales bacterium]|nr:ATP synthase F1 subunit delta [Bacteroidales bacterium]
MKETRVAIRYAKALFDLAIEMKILDKVKDDAQLVSDVCLQNREFVLMLKSPIIKEKSKLVVIREIFKGKIQDVTLKFMSIITNNGREDIIQEIMDQFVIIYKRHMRIMPITVKSAVKLDKDVRDRIVNIIAARRNVSVELTEKIDESLIGGFLLEAESLQYDASISRQIKNLEKEFDVNLYIKGF